jgi:FkbM family methyltransferase
VLEPRTEVDPWQETFEGTATLEDVYYCFRLILGRDPNPEEWPGHSGLAGHPLHEVVRGYVSSAEFANRGLQKLESRFVLVTTAGGFRMFVDPEDLAVGKHISAGVMYEPPVTAAFFELVRPGSGVLDIGANIGWFSLLAAKLAGSEGRVSAVEPNPMNARALEASRALNGFDQLQVIQAAAGEGVGILALYTSGSNGVAVPVGGEPDRILSSETVPVLALDDLIHHRVDVVKIDVEGAELLALRGAERLLRRDRPAIISEFTPMAMDGMSGAPPEEYLRFLISVGYELNVLSEGGAPAGCGTDAAKVMRIWRERGRDHVDLLCLPH